VEAMQKWLLRLRQSCSHPQAGGWIRKAGNTTLRTMSEVLHTMHEDAKTTISRLEREIWSVDLDIGQILDFQKDTEKALNVWTSVLRDVEQKIASLSEKPVSQLSEPYDMVNTDEDDIDTKTEKKSNTARRSLLDIQHRATFLIACAYVILKDETREKEFYDKAEYIRRKVSCAGLC
jgi:E3 ubiquitin-protein ligase SHPRH